MLHSTEGKRGGRFHDHRRVVEGIVDRFRTVCRWRDVPCEFGAWQTRWQRHDRWSTDGTWQRVVEALQALADAVGELDWTVTVDSSVVMVIRLRVPISPRERSSATSSVSRQPDSQGSRAGWSAKIHLAVDGTLRPLALHLTGGHAAALIR